jgi:perosamine synthetase|tara:strand:- start:2570 stop:3826 length:1257 start_codon:yes stop_codon:yes gene_type:complete
MEKLAIFGGPKTREAPFPRHPIIGDNEKKQVLEVLESGNLSTFIASQGEYFLGGKKIKEFEKKFSEVIGTKFAVAFNSATSALHAAIVATGVQPEHEVIVPPYTFTSTATSVLMHNAIPIFSDVKEDTFCLDPKKLDKVKSSLTQAIIPVHLFGHPCDMDEIMEFAKKNKLKVIEDCAQSPGGIYKGKKVGTIGHCGIFSFQETKNIMTGEGGMLVTNDDEIAKYAQMMRNHGEVISSEQKSRSYKAEILGWGYRMTELEASIGIAQIEKLEELNNERIRLAKRLTEKINAIDGLMHTTYEHVKNVYYVYAFTFNEEKIGISREEFCKAVNAEGIPIAGGYVKPLYLNPIYQEKTPYAFKNYQGNAKYDKGICPIAENLFEEKLVLIPVVRPPSTDSDIDDIINAINKVITSNELKKK